MDELDRIRTFVRVVGAGSMSGAARALSMSVPAVSRQVRALENDLGAVLLLRTTRSLSMTDAGKRFHERSLRILRELDAAREDLSADEGVRGRLVVSSGITLGQALVVPQLPALTRKHPQLEIDLRLEDRVVDLLGDGVDVAIRGGLPPPDTDGVIARSLVTGRRIAVASPKYVRAHGRPKTPPDLARHTCLVQVGSTGALDRWRFSRTGEDIDVEVRGRVRSSAPSVVRTLALADMGVAWLPEWLVGSDLANRRLLHLLEGWACPEVPIYALYRAELRRSPRVRAFLEPMRIEVAAL